MEIKLEVHADKCKEKIRQALVRGLQEGGSEVLAQIIRNTRVDTGQLKNSFQMIVDDEELKAVIGSPLENALWEEYGTGERAENGNGRKGFSGKPPSRAMSKAFTSKKHTAVQAVERNLKSLD